MAKFKFPNHLDRSLNDPSIIADSKRVLNLYNQENADDREKVTDSIKEWFVAQALEKGWSSAEFHGNGCVLVIDIAPVVKK